MELVIASVVLLSLPKHQSQSQDLARPNRLNRHTLNLVRILIAKRAFSMNELRDFKILQNMVEQGGQLAVRVMSDVHRKIMLIGYQWGWPDRVRKHIDFDVKQLLQTVMAKILAAIRDWHDP